MGNRANRLKLKAAIRAAGIQLPLYVGNKRVAWRYFNARTVRTLLRKLQFRPGDIVNDCDAFNHEIRRPLPHLWRWSDATWVFGLDQFEFTDGTRSCGCDSSPEPAHTPEQITRSNQFWLNEAEQLKQGGWWSPRMEELCERLRRGEPICDERGFRLPGVE